MLSEIRKKWTPVEVSYQKKVGQAQCTLRKGKAPAIAFNKAMCEIGRLSQYKYVQILEAEPYEFQLHFHKDPNLPGSFDLRAEGNKRGKIERGHVSYVRALGENVKWFGQLARGLERSTQYDVQRISGQLWYVSFKEANMTRIRTTPQGMSQSAEMREKERAKRYEEDLRALQKKHGR